MESHVGTLSEVLAKIENTDELKDVLQSFCDEMSRDSTDSLTAKYSRYCLISSSHLDINTMTAIIGAQRQRQRPASMHQS